MINHKVKPGSGSISQSVKGSIHQQTPLARPADPDPAGSGPYGRIQILTLEKYDLIYNDFYIDRKKLRVQFFLNRPGSGDFSRVGFRSGFFFVGRIRIRFSSLVRSGSTLPESATLTSAPYINQLLTCKHLHIYRMRAKINIIFDSLKVNI